MECLESKILEIEMFESQCVNIEKLKIEKLKSWKLYVKVYNFQGKLVTSLEFEILRTKMSKLDVQLLKVEN